MRYSSSSHRVAFGATFTLLVAVVFAAPSRAAHVAVVCPAEFTEALGPWISLRKAQERTITLLDNRGTAAEIQQRIRRLAGRTRLRFVVLVGDTPAEGADETTAARCVPTFFQKAKITPRFGSESHIATDNPYGDLDGDGVPELAVGRISVRTPAELKSVVAKIVRYESQPVGAWSRNVHVVAGSGNFGPLIDSVLESTTRALLAHGVPPHYRVALTYGNWRSPFCPLPAKFHERTLESLSGGSLFWVYIGHGRRRSLEPMVVDRRRYHVLAAEDAAKLRPGAGSPVALMLACYTCAFDGPRDCLGEALLRSPGGPVAVIGGSRVTMPYAMAVLGGEMLDEVFLRRRASVGEVLVRAKRSMVFAGNRSLRRKTLDSVAGVLSPVRRQLGEERAEHLALFNLLGDPLLRIRYPKEMEIQVSQDAKPGQKITVSGEASEAAAATLELVYPRDRQAFRPQQRPQADRVAAAVFREEYRRANDRRLCAVTEHVPAGPFSMEIEVPRSARGRCLVRLVLDAGRTVSLGSAEIHVGPELAQELKTPRR